LWAALFNVWHLALGAFAWCNVGEDVITKNNSLCDGVNTCIASKTLHMATHVLGHHCDNSAFCACTCRTARPVKESFVFFWWIGVNDNCNVVNVNSASSNVCCDERVYFSAGQCSKVPCTNSL
jgi:hypothetical protein